MCNPYGIIKVDFRFFELYIFIVVKEPFDHIDFIVTDNAGLPSQ
jgi:hypothetical protein